MSIKDNAKNLKIKAQEFGYNIKHTHALELVSQILEGTNRHVALKKEQGQNKNLEEMFFYGRGPTVFRLDKYPQALQLPFFKSHVLMVGLEHTESFELVVADSLSEAMELLGEAGLSLDYIQVLSPEDLDKEVRSGEEEGPEQVKTIRQWIMDKHQTTGDTSFTVFNDYN